MKFHLMRRGVETRYGVHSMETIIKAGANRSQDAMRWHTANRRPLASINGRTC